MDPERQSVSARCVWITLHFCIKTQTSSRLYAAVPLSHGEPNLISTRGQPFIRREGPLEVIIFRARNQAEIFEGRKHLLCFGGLAKH